MTERLEPLAYMEELKALRDTITRVTSRMEGLQYEQKPLALVNDLDLDQLLFLLERAEAAL